MAILLENYPLPSARGHLEFLVTLDVSVTAEEAKRKAEFWLHDEVTMQLNAESPTLVVGAAATVWQVPVHFSLPRYGALGVVGTVSVDSLTGEIVAPEACRAEIIEYLNQKIKPILAFYKKQEQVLPPQFIAKGFPSLRRLILKDDLLTPCGLIDPVTPRAQGYFAIKVSRVAPSS